MNTLPTVSNVVVGSTNKCKVDAVKSCLQQFSAFQNATVRAVAVSSGVSEQPMSLEETAQGAKNRAAAAYAMCVNDTPGIVSFGLESGLFLLHDQYFDMCVCSIFDGRNHHLGLSSGFQVPHAIMQAVHDHGADLSRACQIAGITSSDRIGEGTGLIGLLSHGRLNRQQYTEQAITTALFPNENPKWYPQTVAKPSRWTSGFIVLGLGLAAICALVSRKAR